MVDQSFNFEGGLTTPSEGAHSPSFHRCFPKGLGYSLEASTASGLCNQEESRLHIHSTAKSKVVTSKMIHKSASESKSVDFHRQFISGCQYEQPGRHPLSSNMYLDLKNHGLNECQDDSDSGKCIPRNLNVLVDSLSREIRCFQTKGAMNHQVFNQISHCWHQSVVDVLQQR